MIASGTSGTCTWKIEDNGTLTVKPTNGTEGYFIYDYFGGEPSWVEYSMQIKNVVFTGSIRIYEKPIMEPVKETGNARTLFSATGNNGYKNLESVVGLSSLKGVTTTYDMFGFCSKLTNVDLSSFDTSNVTTMYGMFEGCTSLASLDLSSFDTSKVTDMSAMFYSCASLPSLDLSSFDTSKVTDMGVMFRGCRSLASLDVSSFDTSKVTDMSAMFSECESLESLQLPSSFETANVTGMNDMFHDCKSLTSLDLSSFDTSKVTDKYDTFHLYGMSKMFTGCNLLSSITFGNHFEISSGIDIETPIDFGKGVNQDNGIFVPDDKAFLSLSTTERAGHWTRNVSEIYEVNAYRAEEGTADEGGSDVIIKVRWSTNAQTTDRTLSIFKKLNSESTYPSSAIITKTLSGNSGTEVLTLADAGSEAYDFKVQFYDGINTFVAFPGVPATIELVIVNKEGDVQIKRNFWAAGTVTTKQLFAYGMIGSIQMYGGAVAPNGWLLCQGQALSKNTYADLFNIIGYTYGGSDDTFMLPNLGSRVPIGAGPNAENTTNYWGSYAAGTNSFSVLGERGGHVSATVPSHNHTFHMPTMNSSGSGTSGVPSNNTSGGGGSFSGTLDIRFWGTGHAYTGSSGIVSLADVTQSANAFTAASTNPKKAQRATFKHDNHTHSLSSHTHSTPNHTHTWSANGYNDATGETDAHKAAPMQPYIVLNYIIFTGIPTI